MQTTEVTQAQLVAVVGSNPSHFNTCGFNSAGVRLCSNHPVEKVSIREVKQFLQLLNSKGDGYVYRLPTEAEWEYAARAGTTGPHAGKVDEMPWCQEPDSSNRYSPSEVGKKQTNAWGLYDMHGNVFEWTSDYREDYKAEPVTDPYYGQVPRDDYPPAVQRGGSFAHGASYCRSAVRRSLWKNWGSSYDLGIRLVRTRSSTIQ